MGQGHYENFPVGSWLLPQHLREPIGVIYRFARSADDIADEGNATARERLEALAAYAAELDRIAAGETNAPALFRDVARIVRKHDLPLASFRDLLDAFRQDVVKTRYADFEELMDYCRRSANPVGRLLLHLFRRTDAAACACADAICTSLQLINFWQDVALDWAKGRLYLPQDDMRRHGVSEAQVAEGRCDAAWRSLLQFECERARDWMLRGAALKDMLRGRARFEIAVTMQGGLRILERLAASDYDMFRQRPVLRAADWPLLVWRAI